MKFDGAEIWIETDEEAAEAAVPERVGVLKKAEKFIPFEKFSDTIRFHRIKRIRRYLLSLLIICMDRRICLNWENHVMNCLSYGKSRSVLRMTRAGFHRWKWRNTA